MTVRPILRWPDKRLRARAATVEAVTDEIRAIWTDMVDTMDAMPGLGLAAPQIGVMLRLAVVDVTPDRSRRILLANPEVIEASADLRAHEEGSPCLPGLSARLERPRVVTVRYLNSDGAIIERAFEDVEFDQRPAPDRSPRRADVFRTAGPGETRHAAAQGAQGAGLMRIVFMGTPDFAVPVLEALVADGQDIVCVYCQPPRPAGRGKKDRPSPVQARAEELGLPVRHPVSLKGEEDQTAFAELDAEIAVVVAYGLILPQAILDAPQRGCLNVHASLLPRWRGAAPIHRAIMAGDAETGVCIMQMEAGLDTGPVLLRQATPIGPEETTGELQARLAEIGATAIVAALQGLGGLSPLPQPEEGATYATKIDKSEAHVDWTRPAVEVDRLIRGFAPFPGAWRDVDGVRVKFLGSRLAEGSGEPGEVLDDALTVACGQGAVQLTRLQKAGRGAQEAADFLHGLPIRKGTRL